MRVTKKGTEKRGSRGQREIKGGDGAEREVKGGREV